MIIAGDQILFQNHMRKTLVAWLYCRIATCFQARRIRILVCLWAYLAGSSVVAGEAETLCQAFLRSSRPVFLERVLSETEIQLQDGTPVILADLISHPNRIPTDQHDDQGSPLKAFLAEGQALQIAPLNHDRYGRLVAHIGFGHDMISPNSSGWLQARLLKTGSYFIMPSLGSPCALYLARAVKLPLVKFEKTHVITSRNARTNLEAGRYHQVIMRVHSARVLTRRVYLNSSADWERDFTITVDPDAYVDFLKTEEIPVLRPGDYIKATGWVTEWNGAAIHVTHPAQLQLTNQRPEILKSKSPDRAVTE